MIRRQNWRKTGSGRKARRSFQHPLVAEVLEQRFVFDSTVVFNELMYHPTGDETKLEWIELHNQMAVDMDLSGWSLDGGVHYTFSEGTKLAGGAYMVVAVSPADLQAASGYAGAKGPFTGVLDNSGETLLLRNNNNRIMDEMTYGDDGAWPVAPDGSGVSLAKRDKNLGSADPASWTFSGQVGGTPGVLNFATDPVTQTTTPLAMNGTWKYNQSGATPDPAWFTAGYNDSAWSSGGALFHAGTPSQAGNPQAITTLFNTGIAANGQVLAPGAADPHYVLTASAQNPALPPNTPATVAQNHSAWLANDASSSWISVISNGNLDIAAGAYNFRTTFDLGGYDASTAILKIFVSCDNRVTDIKINGFSTGYNFAGFQSYSPEFTINSHFVSGLNTLEFLTANDGTTPNPGAFRAKVSGTAVVPITPTTELNLGPNTYYFRTQFDFAGDAAATLLSLRTAVDDGAVFYLNGQRVYAQNMPQGAVNYSTPASNNVTSPSFAGPFDLPAGALQHGTNVLAVEVHQALGGTDDMLFGSSLTAKETLFDPLIPGAKLAFNEISGSATGPTSVELINYGTTDLQIGGYKIKHSLGAEYVVPNQALTAGSRVVISENDLGVHATEGSKFFLFNSAGNKVLDAVAVKDAARGRSPEGTGRWLFVDQLTPGAANTFALHNEVVINEIMYQHRPEPATHLTVQNSTPVLINSTWKYDQAGVDRGTSWTDPLFNDTAWPSGQAVFYAGIPQGQQGQVQPITTLFSTGVGANGLAIAPGNPDPHYFMTVSAQGNANIPATVISNHPAWVANNATSSWIGPINPGTADSNAGNYNYRTTFDLTGFDPNTATITMFVAADNSLNDVLINGVSTGVSYPTYTPLSGQLSISSGFISGINTLEFVTNNAGGPGGFLARVSGTAAPLPLNTQLNLGTNTYYFRNQFNFSGNPAATQLQLSTMLDDGAVYYLNGQEIYRQNMAAAPATINFNSQATNNIGTPSVSQRFTVAAGALRQGVNVLAVEVHQAIGGANDMAFGAQLFATETLTPELPFHESNEEWIELFNRSQSAVDLTGWRLDEGIDFSFPVGTTIGAGQYLVVAKEKVALASLYPNITIVGNYGGTLSNGGETVVLKDANNNPADEVTYYDSGRWPTSPDGGGTSLELKDPDSDNSKAESWAASDESSKSQWKIYTYRGVASPSIGPDGVWNEFVMGLLDAGEILIDDIRVVRAPATAPVQMLQNGTFEVGGANKWRIIGDHSHSEVIVDPTNPANHVLRLVATGPTEHMHNHAETTLINGTIDNNVEYEISYRAKWISGSSLLNTRLYFNRVAKTTAIDVPALTGTPGAQNTRFQANVGPTYGDFQHGPLIPAANQAVTVTVRAADPENVASVTLLWKVNDGNWSSAPMTGVGGQYTGTIPGFAAGSVVQFYVQGVDGQGAVSTYPAAGLNSRALYKVDGSVLPSQPHNLRIVMTPADATILHTVTNVMSDDDMFATVYYDDKQVFYNVRVSLQGSERGRSDASRVGFHVGFDPDNLFRGVQSSISLDHSGGYSGRGGKNDEIVAKQARNHAGGEIPSMYDDLVNVIAPRPENSGPSLMLTARYGSDFLDSNYDNGSDGTAYKFELVYYPTSTTGGAEGLKLPQPDGVIGTDIRNLGNNQEAYRWNFLIQSHRDRDDYSTLIKFAQALTLSGSALDAATKEVMDVEEWLRTFGMMSLVGVGDIYTSGNDHNLQLYVRPEDNKVLAMPWDWDFAWSNAFNAPLYGGENFSRVIALPGNLRSYYAHLHDMITTTFNASYMGQWTTGYGALVGQNYAGVLDYINQRSNYVLSQLPAQIPFNITTNGGLNFSAGAVSSTTIGGDAWYRVKNIFIEGRAEPLQPTWTDADSWQVNVPLLPGPNVLHFIGRDINGVQIAEDTITVTSTLTAPSQKDNLRITELMYHPADPPAGSLYSNSDFEFVEIQNKGTQPLQLAGAKLAGGIDFIFPAQSLAAGAFVLVVNNKDAFESRYGTGHNIAGEFGGNLSNSGEPVQLLDSVGQEILSFTYAQDWVPSTDGTGPSMVILDVAAPTDNWKTAAGGRARRATGGSPGLTDPSVSIAGRHIFYNNSVFDTDDPAASAADDAAIAPDKTALLSGTASFANYTSYSRGINGIMVDIFTPTKTPVADDFIFRVGNQSNVANWTAAPLPLSVTERAGAGINGSNRVTITWPDDAIRGQWLQVTVKTTLGLAAPDVFYFGNAPGEAGNSSANAFVDASDEILARQNPRTFTAPAPIDFRYDFNRDGFVNAADQIIARSNASTVGFSLELINFSGGLQSMSMAASNSSASPPSETLAVARVGVALAQDDLAVMQERNILPLALGSGVNASLASAADAGLAKYFEGQALKSESEPVASTSSASSAVERSPLDAELDSQLLELLASDFAVEK